MALFLAATAAEGCAISGRVVDDRGGPVPFAAVSISRGLSNQRVNGVTADRGGEYCIRELAAGEYLIRAVARMRPPSASPACKDCCEPGSELEALAIPVKIGNKPTGVNIKMRRVPAYCVRGEVRDRAGALLGDAAIAIEGDSWSAGVINEGGRFLLTNLPAGSYTLVIGDRRQLGRVLARRVIQVAAANVTGLVVNASPAAPGP